ncbi:hypothetical protein F5Y04DRAFT_245819 [Hypomontagnella monticulosa]|nr:hypothetical protein F5Y04DRAFT_245819 [Hypomontagnella monticulosa]
MTFQIGHALAQLSLKLPESGLDLSSKVIYDPLRVLPAEVIYDICSLLPFESISPFIRASWHVLCIANDRPGFWKDCIRCKFPWFLEMDELLRQGALKNEQLWKGIFFWAGTMVRARRGGQ